MARPKNLPKTGGRKKGTLNKATCDIRKLAQVHGEDAIGVLVGIMNNPEALDASRISAAEKLIERGYGRVPQPVVGSDEQPPIQLRAKVDYSRLSGGAIDEVMALVDEATRSR